MYISLHTSDPGSRDRLPDLSETLSSGPWTNGQPPETVSAISYWTAPVGGELMTEEEVAVSMMLGYPVKFAKESSPDC